jgi:hypothetical protein
VGVCCAGAACFPFLFLELFEGAGWFTSNVCAGSRDTAVNKNRSTTEIVFLSMVQCVSSAFVPQLIPEFPDHADAR